MTTFNELGLAAPLLSALETEGYATPTPIQAQAIPTVMTGKDLLGIAQTGTGKTAAFALPILHRLAADPKPAPARGCRVLVLAPTRELASQIGESFRTYGRNLKLTVAVVFGGVAHRPQITALTRGVDILVATPGRLLDHMAERVVGLSHTSIFVLDEADQMLDLGFLPPIRKIVRQLPAQRQSLFFSATMPHDIAQLAAELLHNPARVAVARVGTTAELVSQRVIHIDQKRKSALLAELLTDASMTRTLVFTRTKRGADKVARHLEAVSVTSAAIHGNKSQRQREIALEAFRNGKIRVLVATDIAARGIDIDEVTHVVNYDLPEVPDAYVHRIGRTARAGASGQAIAMCDPEERDLLRAIERLTRQAIPSEDRRNDESLAVTAGTPGRAREQRGGQRNGRPNHSGRNQGEGGAHRHSSRDNGGSRSEHRSEGRGQNRDAAAHRNGNGNANGRHRPARDNAGGGHQSRDGTSPREQSRDQARGPSRGQSQHSPAQHNASPRAMADVGFMTARPDRNGDHRRADTGTDHAQRSASQGERNPGRNDRNRRYRDGGGRRGASPR